MNEQQCSWIWEENLIPFCEVASDLIGYGFDSSDAIAVGHGLSTADETQGLWFRYVLMGQKEISMELTREVGTSVVTIETSYPKELHQELSMLYQICASYVLSRGPHA